jgi:hypothetical protein
MVRACNALKQENPQWDGKRVGFFAHLEGGELAHANVLLRQHYNSKERSDA